MGADDELAHGIQTFIAAQTGADAVRVSGLRRLTGGASRETWSLDAMIDHASGTDTLPLILQRDVRGAPKELSRAAEFQLMQPREREREGLLLHPGRRAARVRIRSIERTEETGVRVGRHLSPRESEIKSVAVVGSTAVP